MKRAVLALLVTTLTLVPVLAAHGQQEVPQGRFSSPTRAVAGQPIFVRSITPCPVTPGAYQFVRVGISPQGKPDSLSYIESTDADLGPGGSWEVTLSTPTDMSVGVTKSYDVQAQCIENDAPYAAPSRDPSVTVSTLPPEFSYFRYFQRRLYVTGFGTSDASSATDATVESTTTTSSVTTTTAPTTTTIETAEFQATGIDIQGVQGVHDDDADARLAEVRRELALRQRSADAGAVALSASVASTSLPTAEPDKGGVPLWAFVLATMLAVGAVIGYGARRTTDLER